MTGIVQGTALTKPHALRRILTNFIDNALKFAGAAEVRIERSGEGKIVITVTDRGPGIPDDNLEAANRSVGGLAAELCLR